MPKITELYAWVVADKDEDDEGIPALLTIAGYMPLMGADMESGLTLRQRAVGIADAKGKPIKLVRSRGELEVVEVIHPKTRCTT